MNKKSLQTAVGHPAAKALLFGLCLLPFFNLLRLTLASDLGANPAEFLIRATGDWTLRFLCVSLAVTPVRTWTSTPQLARFRRMLGLFVYFYVLLHLSCYALFDMELDATAMGKDIAKRPFILVGFAAFVLLTPLALTSFNRAVKALGAKRWQQLHRAVYAIAGLGILHFFWMRAAKHNFVQVKIYAGILLVLLGWRLWRWLAQRFQKRSQSKAHSITPRSAS